VSVFLVRLLITGASIGDALVIIALAALYGLYLHIEAAKEPSVNEDIRLSIKALEEKVSKSENKIGAMSLRNR